MLTKKNKIMFQAGRGKGRWEAESLSDSMSESLAKRFGKWALGGVVGGATFIGVTAISEGLETEYIDPMLDEARYGYDVAERQNLTGNMMLGGLAGIAAAYMIVRPRRERVIYKDREVPGADDNYADADDNYNDVPETDNGGDDEYILLTREARTSKVRADIVDPETLANLLEREKAFAALEGPDVHEARVRAQKEAAEKAEREREAKLYAKMYPNEQERYRALKAKADCDGSSENEREQAQKRAVSMLKKVEERLNMRRGMGNGPSMEL